MKKWTLVKPTLRDLMMICAQMRPDEIEQYLAFHDVDGWDFEEAAATFYQLPGVKFSLLDPHGTLIGVAGYVPLHGKVWRSWMVGTLANWATHWRALTESTRYVMDCLIEDGALRLETLALETRSPECFKWYEKGLKMQREGVLRNYGVRGENAVAYSRVAPTQPAVEGS